MPNTPGPKDATVDITKIMVPKITETIEPEMLQEFLDTFAESLRVDVVLRDADGEVITRSKDTTLAGIGPDGALDAGREKRSRELAMKAVKSGGVERRRSQSGRFHFAVPVMLSGNIAGALVVTAPPDEEARRSPRDLSVAISLLQFAANVLADLCHEGWIVRRHVAELRTLHRVSQLLNSTRHLNEVLHLVTRTVCETLTVKACGLRLLDPDTGNLFIKAGYGLSPKYLQKGPVQITDSVIDRDAMEGAPVYITDIREDPRILYPAEMEAEGIRSNLVIGLKVRGRAIGALRIYTGEKRYFHQSEIVLAEAIANLAAIAIENAKLYEEALEKERLEYELGLAGQIQTHLLPSECPHPEGFDMCAVNEPCRQVGGDYFDYIPDPFSKRLGICIADVCGKSMGGALLMATARSALRVQSEHCLTPAEIVTRVNMSLCRDTRPEEFVTLFFAKLDPLSRTLHYANAGHNRPLLYRGDEAIPLEGAGMVCGVLADNNYHEYDLQLQSGDILLLYTDGLDEARNEQEQLFGLERTGEVIRANRGKPASEIVQMLRDEVHRFAGKRVQSDDLTMILIKVL